MILFDSHAHINDIQFKDDLDSVVNRAKENNVKYILDVGYNTETIKRSIEISQKYPFVYSAFGFHPHDAKDVKNEDLIWLKTQLNLPKCKALGEIGLDSVKPYSPKEIQEKIFIEQLKLAKESLLPVIFHSRGAEEKVLDYAVDFGIKKAVFHCFTGNENIVKKIMEKGYYISFAGFITYNNSSHLWIKDIPMDKFFIETDCPYLAPVPYRGKRNEPSYVKETALKIADILKISLEAVAETTFRNAKEFFNV